MAEIRRSSRAPATSRARPGGRIGGRIGALLTVMAALASGSSAQALVINASYDASVNSAPGGFKTAFQNAIGFFQSTYSDPISISIGVGWGEVGGSAVASGALGESETYLASSNYSQVRNALASDHKSAADATAVASLPAADPTGGKPELLATAEAKALGLRSGGGTDGFVGFDASAPWTFNTGNRAVSGAFDFIGVAEHEISEVMGRMADVGTFYNALTPLDLFRYSAPGARALTAGNNQYFSINGGSTSLNYFGGPGGDLGDWAGNTIDAYNAFAYSGVMLPVSPNDITEMDVLGYDLGSQPSGHRRARTTGTAGAGFGAQAADVPEPASLLLLATALLGLGFRRRRRSGG